MAAYRITRPPGVRSNVSVQSSSGNLATASATSVVPARNRSRSSDRSAVASASMSPERASSEAYMVVGSP
jgi:hypothetical protein